MESFKVHLQSWQRDDEGKPLFRSTNDAHAYAHLIVDDDYECERMRILKKSIYDELDIASDSDRFSLQQLLDMACRCQ